MSDDTDLAPAENDDLRSQLTAAFEADKAPEPVAEETSEAAKDARARDELGRFAPKDAPEAPQAVEKAPEAPKAPEQPAAVPEQATAPVEGVRPPPGWSVAAKAAFDNLPAEVREAVAKREQEVNQGFAKLAEFKPLERYADMARQGGTTLEKALESYTGIETMLRTNPVQGFAQIAQNLGTHPVQMAQQILAAYGQPANQTAMAPGPQVDPSVMALFQQQLAPLQQTIQQLTAEKQAQHQAQIDSALSTFFSDPANKFAENVVDTMVPFIKQRQATNPGEKYVETLKWAYDQAAWANPDVREILINERNQRDAAAAQAKATQAKASAKSIVGSPAPGAAAANDRPADDLRTELQRQIAAFGGARI